VVAAPSEVSEPWVGFVAVAFVALSVANYQCEPNYQFAAHFLISTHSKKADIIPAMKYAGQHTFFKLMPNLLSTNEKLHKFKIQVTLPQINSCDLVRTFRFGYNDGGGGGLPLGGGGTNAGL